MCVLLKAKKSKKFSHLMLTFSEQEFLEYYYTQFYAGCVIISIPISILFLLTQKCYVEGVSGAVKG